MVASRSTLRNLAEAYGTPLYVYDLDEISRAEADLRHAIPANAELYYSLKANPHPSVVAHVRHLGCHMEVSSPGELAVALAAGVPRESVLFSGPGKGAADLDAIGTSTPALVSVESADDARRVGAALPCDSGVGLLARVNLDEVGAGYGLMMAGRPSQFGIDAMALMDDPDLLARCCGLHFYSGTNLADPDELVVSFRSAIEFVEAVACKHDWRPEVLDLGGGFGHPYGRAGSRPDLRSIQPALEMLIARVCRAGVCEAPPRLLFESGRYLTAASGSLVLRVIDVKESKGRSFAVLDGGINAVAGSQSVLRLSHPAVQPEHLSEEPSAEEARGVDIVGPLCTVIDVLNRGQHDRLRPGELVAIPNLGAYGLSASLLAFLSRPIAAEVVLAGGEPVHASRLVLNRCALTRSPERA